MDNNRRWVQRQSLWLVIAAALLLAVFENTRLDVILELPFYDPALNDFPLRNHWLLSDVMHHGLKTASYVLGILSIAFCLYAMRGKVAWLPPRHAALVAVGMLLIPVLISSLKHVTNRHCPWDVLEFGGFAPYVGLFAPNPPGITRGLCFPAGHASAGLAWLVWGFALMGLNRRWSNVALLAGLSFGAILGFGRMLQGAHFLSHTLWSIWFAWGLCVLLVFVLRVPVQLASALPTTSATSGDSPSVEATRSSAARIDT